MLPGNDLCAAPCCPNAVHVSDAERPRRRLTGKGHMAADVAVVVRSAHPEPTSGHGLVRERVARMSDGRQSGYEAGEDQRAHYR